MNRLTKWWRTRKVENATTQEQAMAEIHRYQAYGLDPSFFVKASNYTAVEQQIKYAKRQVWQAKGFVIWFVFWGAFVALQPLGHHRSVVTTVCGLMIAACGLVHATIVRRWSLRRREAEQVLASMSDLPKKLKEAGVWR